MNKSILPRLLAGTACCLLALGALSGCKKFSDQRKASNTTTSGTLFMACDESFQRIMEQEIDVFEFQYPEATILANYVPESVCIDSLVFGRKTRVAVVSRELTQAEKESLTARKRTPRSMRIAVDAIAIIANPENPVTELTVSDLRKILSGEIKQWRWVEPGNNSGDISIVFDYSGSSTVSYMRDSILRGDKFGDNVYAQNDMARVFDAVSKTRGALGIIGVSWISYDMSKADMSTEEIARSLEVNDTTNIAFNDDVKVLAIAGPDQTVARKPYQAYIYDGSYPLFRSMYMITTGGGGTLAAGFYSFVTGFAGQKLIQQTGVLPGAISPRIVQVE